MTALPDGTYDAFVIDASDDRDGRHLELTIVSGERKGEVVAITSTDTDGTDLDLIGLPATVVVRDGVPNVVIDA